ncbi:MAG: dipeptide epimerase [Candidatus Omnitrophica bacterium]|nr:dipeptide epimerase [Candidatus Omnitrophota bacterium]
MIRIAKNKACTVTEAEVFVLRAPLSSPFRIATGQHDFLENVFLRLHLSDGIAGCGEAAVATHITGETVPQTVISLKKVAAKLLGCDISTPLVTGMEFRSYFRGNHAGLAAFEMALLDAYSRSQGMPFWRLFTPQTAPDQPVLKTDVTIVLGSLEEAAEATQRYAGRGFQTFKVKLGRDEELDFRRVLEIRRLAPEVEIVLDANQAFTAEGALRFVKRLVEAGVHPALVEQPVPKKDWDGLKQVTRSLGEMGILVCADESVGSLEEAAHAVRTGSVSAINIKFMKSGILESVEIARLARSAGVQLMIGAMMESALSITAAAHFAGALGCFSFIDIDTTYFIQGELACSPCLDGGGRFDLSGTGPGIGVQFAAG